MRHLKILEFALSSLLRRRYKNLSLLAVYTFTIAILASILLLTHALKTEASRLLDGGPELVVQRLSAGRHDLISTEAIAQIRKIPGVTEVKPRYWGYYYDALVEANYTLQGIESVHQELTMVDGRLPAGNNECAIGQGVANVRKVGSGDDLILVDSTNTGTVLTVVGVFRSESELLTNDLVVLEREDLIRFFTFPPDRATDLAVKVANPAEINTVAAKIKRIIPDSRPITRNEILQTYAGVFNWRSGMMLTVFSAALIAFCILAWDKATGISAEEKREIGILKALGWETSDILELKFWEGLVISLTALLLGILTAYVHVFYWDATVLAPVLKGWSVLFPDFRLTPFIDFYQLLTIGFLTVVPYIASTIIPAWNAAITDPESAMRG